MVDVEAEVSVSGFAQDHAIGGGTQSLYPALSDARKSLLFSYPGESFPERLQVTAKWHVQSLATSHIDIWQKLW